MRLYNMRGTSTNIVVASVYERLMRLLVENGADTINTLGRSGYTATMLANTELIGLLMEYGADIKAKIGGYESAWQTFLADDQRRRGGRSLLRPSLRGSSLRHRSSSRKNEALVAGFLSKHGAEVTAQDGKYGSALHAALIRGRAEIKTSPPVRPVAPQSRPPKKTDPGMASSSSPSNSHGSFAESTVTLEGGFTGYLSDESEAELLRQTEAKAALLMLYQAGELETAGTCDLSCAFPPSEKLDGNRDAVDGSNGAVYAELSGSGCTGVPCMHMYNSI
jgi:hypothetical protein